MNNRPRISALLPLRAARELQRAALTPIPDADPLARLKAIENTTEWVKQIYPEYFRKEK